MVCLKHAGLKSNAHQHTRTGKRYGVLRLHKFCSGSLLATFKSIQVDKPPPGFVASVMGRII